MKRTIPWKWLFAVSLSLNLGVFAALFFRQLEAPVDAAQPRLNLPHYLQLSETQEQRWRELEPDFQRELASNWREIGKHREALIMQIFSTAPQREKIAAEQARIAALQDAQQQRVIAQLLAERELLNEQQRAKLRDLLLTRYRQEATEEEMLHRE